MSQRGKISTAHIYDIRGQCIYCQMYKTNVDALAHECTVEQEAKADAKFYEELKKEVEHGK